MTRLLVLQSGGPTAVLNATLASVIQRARALGFTRVLGARRGFRGLLEEDLVDLSGLSQAQLSRLAHTPGAALGTSRERLDERSALQVVDLLHRNRIDAVIPIGGNDSAANAVLLQTAARSAGLDLALVHAPKTVDNDLPETDHTPGYPSAARFLALATRGLLVDSWSVRELYACTILEVQGRNAGWLAAACAAVPPAGLEEHLVLLLPERPPDTLDALVEEVIMTIDRRGWVLVVVPETLRDRSGRPLSGTIARWVDPHGHVYPPSPAETLAAALEKQAGIRTRVVRPNAVARSLTALTSHLDQQEAWEIGTVAVDWIRDSPHNVMVGLQRLSDAPYQVEYRAVPLSAVAGRERPLAETYIGADGRSVSPAFRRYLLPLIAPLDPADEPFLL